MSKHALTVTPLPPRWARWLISLVILAHFFAIGTAVTSVPLGGYPPPVLAVRAMQLTQDYLRFVMLSNAYRFYAPDPGPTALLWFRIQYQDGSVRWVEFPRRKDYFLRMTYQRRLSMPMFVDNSLAPTNPDDPNSNLAPTPYGTIILSSYARQVARTYSLSETNRVKEIEIHIVRHAILTPLEANQGIDPYDIRSYYPFAIGSYGEDGAALDSRGPSSQLGAVRLPTADTPPGPERPHPIYPLVARILEEQVYPHLEQSDDKNVETAKELHGLPVTILKLLATCPELLDTKESQEDVIQRIRKAVTSRDRPAPMP